MSSSLSVKDVIGDIALFAGQSGSCPDSEKAFQYINYARRLLWNRGDWLGTLEYGCLNACEGCAYLPWDLEVIREAWLGIRPIDVRDEWWQSLSYAGLKSCCGSCCSGALIQTGRKRPIVKPLCGSVRIKIWSNETEEEGTQIVFKAIDRYDTPRDLVFTYTDGEFNTVETNICDIEHVIKPATKGVIFVQAIYPNTGNKTLIAHYKPDQINPEFNEYELRIPQAKKKCQILIKAKKKYFDVQDENDIIGIENIVALEFAAEAINAKRNKDITGYSNFLNAATEQLRQDLLNLNPEPSAPLDVEYDRVALPPRFDNYIYNNVGHYYGY